MRVIPFMFNRPSMEDLSLRSRKPPIWRPNSLNHYTTGVKIEDVFDDNKF